MHGASRHESRASILASLPQHERDVFYMSLTPEEKQYLLTDWRFWGRPEQIEPDAMQDLDGPSVWLIIAGRGWGKTRTGSEWIRANVCGPTPLAAGRAGRIALVGETAADVRDVMVQGTAGVLACHPKEFRPVYIKGNRALTWPNGAIALTFSAEDPEQLRGPEHELAWSDELAKWRYAQETWDMLQFGLRAGDNPRQLVTTTPRPIPLVKELMASPDTLVTRGSTFENAAHLAPKFLRKIRERYEGTRLGRQELSAEILDDAPGALWTRSMMERRSNQYPLGARMAPHETVPNLQRVVVAIDPSGTSGEAGSTRDRRDEKDTAGDDVGIIVAGIGVDGLGYVLEDATCQMGPAGWGRRAIEMYYSHMADCIVGEANFGGAMVEFTIRSVDRRVKYKAVHASRGKVLRAEPVAALYEQGRVRHVGALPKLEDQMCQMTNTGYLGDHSPDRLDAMVWAITELMFAPYDRGGAVPIRGHH